jgi:molybdopterin converting factor subunit 1
LVRVKILYFAQAREAAGTRSEYFSLDDRARVMDALSKAFASHPKLKEIERSIKVALNEEVTEDDARLHDGDRVALLPPIVGG